MPDEEKLFPIVQEMVQHKMERKIAKAGVKNIRVHDFRVATVRAMITGKPLLSFMQYRYSKSRLMERVKLGAEEGIGIIKCEAWQMSCPAFL